MNRDKESETLLVASMAAAELRTILGVEVSGPQFLAACQAADEKLVKCLGPVPSMDVDELGNATRLDNCSERPIIANSVLQTSRRPMAESKRAQATGEFELPPAPPAEKEDAKYVVDFGEETESLKDLFPEPVEPGQMIQMLWKHLLDKKLLKLKQV